MWQLGTNLTEVAAAIVVKKSAFLLGLRAVARFTFHQIDATRCESVAGKAHVKVEILSN